MKWLLIILGILFFMLGIFAFTKARSDIQIIIGLVGLSAAFILWGLSTILQATQKLNKHLTVLIGAENPKPVDPKVVKNRKRRGA
jgi:hypothetical protein